MKFLFENRPIQDKIVIGKICFDILSQDIGNKELSEEFCGIWVEGRNREVNFIEDLASIKSFYLYSEKLYPMLVFCHNDNNFLQGLDIKNLPIQVIKIPEINTHKGYSDFCKFELPFLIPNKYQRLLYLQADAFLIKNGWELYINSLNVDYIGSPWLHYPTVELYQGGEWCRHMFLSPSRVGNGAISYRTLNNMKRISERYVNLMLREYGTQDKEPSEDLFFSSLTQLSGNLATLKEAQKFVADPLTLELYNNKSVFGGHFPVYRDEFREKYLKNIP